MPKENIPWHKARKVTPEETKEFRKAIENTLGVKRPPRGRPPKSDDDKYVPVSIRLHPEALAWAKSEAKRRKVGYQTIINGLLMEQLK